MDHDSPATRWPIWGVVALAGTALLRLASLGRLALTDNTESRYASIGWQMFQSGDWVTPRLHIQGELVPFWGKPPLQFWLTSLSYRVFGVSEWSARLPSYLLGAAIVAATVFFAYRVWGRRVAALAGIVLASSGLFFVLSGACVLDVPLAAAVTAAMIAFARFAAEGRRRRAWGLGFFLALAAGALAKGPIALVLVGLAIGIWLVIVGRWRLAIELPWLSGLVLFFAVAAPWYILAERATPGFLRYFLIHEHFLRYVSHDYGDLYGGGRRQPLGAIWLMLAGSFLPWSVLAAAAIGRLLRGGKIAAALRDNPWLAYALAWGLAPALFFTFARQILLTYLLPGLPGLAIATAVGLDRWMESGEASLLRWLKWHVALVGLAALAGAVAAMSYGAALPAVAAVAAATPLVVWLGRPMLRLGRSAALAATLGLATTATGAATVFLVAPTVDDEHSAKIILAKLYAGPAAHDRPVVAASNSECSPAFYTEAIFHGRFEHHRSQGPALVRELLGGQGGEIVLFHRKRYSAIGPELAARLRPVAETAHWIACQPIATDR